MQEFHAHLKSVGDFLYRKLTAGGAKVEIVLANNSPHRLIQRNKWAGSGKIAYDNAGNINTFAIAGVAGQKRWGVYGTYFGACW